MEIILIKDHEKIGKEGQIKKVSDGYARNFLIPRGYALPSTAANLKQLKAKQKTETRKKEKDAQKAKQIKEKIESQTFPMKVKCGENGKLYGAITNKKISEYLSEKGFDIDRKKIILKDPIKKTGSHIIEIKLFENITADMSLNIEEA